MYGEPAFTPPSSAPDGGYFAAPRPAPEPSWPSPAPGYGPSSGPSFGAPGGTAAAGSSNAGIPPFVIAAAVSLAIAAVAALWLGLTMLVALSAISGTGVPVGAGMGVDGTLLVLNGPLDLYLARQLLRGNDLARGLVSGVCGLWVLYWLYEASRATQAFGQLSSSPFGGMGGFGRVAFMATLGILLLAGWAGATAGLLWTSSTAHHFGKTPR